jgi:hypothetical protein
VRTIVTAAVKAHRVDPKLHRVLAEQLPRRSHTAGRPLSAIAANTFV